MTTLNTFGNVKDPYLRSYNQLVVVTRLMRQGKRNQSKHYLSQLTGKARLSIALIAIEIKKKGIEVVKKTILYKLANKGKK